jgi:hypothetical protein
MAMGIPTAKKPKRKEGYRKLMDSKIRKTTGKPSLVRGFKTSSQHRTVPKRLGSPIAP